jgi:hypothetical protein
MAPKEILAAFALLLVPGPASAERDYYPAPRGGAGHRAGAFYANGPVTVDPSRGHHRRRHTSQSRGHAVHPPAQQYGDYSRGETVRGREHQP